jgi:peroxiredoxin Q/BCP
MLHRNATVFAAALVTCVTVGHAQAPAAQPEVGPKVGEMAPDFTLKGSTKDGLLPKPIHLADFRGQTVVLAFFPKARTKG